MEIRAKQNLYRNYWVAIAAIVLFPELIYLIMNGFGDSEPIAYWIGFRMGIAMVYFVLVALISGILYLLSWFVAKNWDLQRFLNILIICSMAYTIFSLGKLMIS